MQTIIKRPEKLYRASSDKRQLYIMDIANKNRNYFSSPHITAYVVTSPTSRLHPAKTVLLPAALSGSTPVALLPRYHEPRSVNLPFEFNMAAFSPTLLTELRKLPNQE